MPIVKPSTKTPWQRHAEKWSACTLCKLCEGRRQVVLGRGTIPADVLFVGEAPGISEDALGKPFVGPAGHLLDGIIEEAGGNDFRLAWTNVVACFPKEQKASGENEPPKDAILACKTRLIEFVRICRPKLIVNVGTLSKKWITGQSMFDPVDWTGTLEFIDIDHPAYILRMNELQQDMAYRRAVVRLAGALELIR